jgi:hypothetical protein
VPPRERGNDRTAEDFRDPTRDDQRMVDAAKYPAPERSWDRNDGGLPGVDAFGLETSGDLPAQLSAQILSQSAPLRELDLVDRVSQQAFEFAQTDSAVPAELLVSAGVAAGRIAAFETVGFVRSDGGGAARAIAVPRVRLPLSLQAPNRPWRSLQSKPNAFDGQCGGKYPVQRVRPGGRDLGRRSPRILGARVFVRGPHESRAGLFRLIRLVGAVVHGTKLPKFVPSRVQAESRVYGAMRRAKSTKSPRKFAGFEEKHGRRESNP